MERGANLLYFSAVEAPSRFEVTMAHVTDCWPGWSWRHPGEIEDALMIWTVARGRGTLRTGGETLAIGGGDCFVLRMWDSVAVEQEVAHPLLIYWNAFRVVGRDGLPIDLSALPQESLPAVHRVVADLPFLLALQQRLITPSLEGAGLNPQADTWLLALLAELQAIDRASAVAGEDREQYEAIRHLCAQILEESGRGWTASRMARALHYSPDHFGRLFRRFVGKTPSAFVIHARMEAAKSLLRGSSASITQIASHLGYGDVYFFSRQFREKVGVPPTEYRERGGKR
jgi:AraC family transcriptional regulator, arabinose operon regulatory protein